MAILKDKFSKRTAPTRVVNIKCTQTELDAIKANAEKYTDGNVSLWIRFSAMEMVPKKRHKK